MNEEVFKNACVEAANQLCKEFIEKIEGEPNVKLPKRERKKIISFLKDLDNGKYGKNESDDKKVIVRPTRKALKVLLVAAIILIITATTVFAVAPLRDFVITLYDDYITVIFDKGDSQGKILSDFDQIPKEFILKEKSKSSIGYDARYENANGDRLIISALKNGATIALDSEVVDSGDITVNGNPGKYTVDENGSVLTWTNNGYTYVITSDNTSNLTIDDLVVIAESQK